MNIESSILSIDQSTLSVLHPNSKSPSEQKNQELFKQCSEYRTQIRQLKQDNQWLHSINQGLTNQCNVLKEILNEKKQAIMECNTDLRIANQEINRLEDLLGQREEDIIAMQGKENGKIVKLQAEIVQMRKIVTKLEKELDDKNQIIKQMTKQKDLAKVQYQSKEKVYIHEVQQKVLKILDRCQKSDKSHHESSTTQNNQNILNQLLAKTQHLATNLQKQRQQHTTQLKQKSLALTNNERKIEILEYQLKQASDLVEQYQTENIKSSKKIKEIETKYQNLVKNNSKNLENSWQLYRRNVDKLVELFSPLIKEEEDMIVRLGQLMKTNKNQYQIDVVVQQLRLIITGYINTHQNQSSLKKQLKDKQNKINLLQQQYDSLKLKHLTLQRQFQAIIDDNRRILKFNQLSRYRAQRNMRNNDHQYERPNINYTNTRGSIGNGSGGSGNKENMMNFNNVRVDRKEG